MASAPGYCIDSSALIHGWRRAYRPKNFPSIWVRLDSLISAGRLRASVEVLREIEKKDDDLFAWCRVRSELLGVEIDDNVQRHMRRIMAAHPRMVDTVKGRSGADPFVIAVAMATDPALAVVSEENPSKDRIPSVCAAVGVRCIRLADLIEEEDWRLA